MTAGLRIGDRIRLTKLGIARSPRTSTRSGVVVALPRPKYRSRTVGILLDGNKTPTAMHHSYFELDPDAKNSTALWLYTLDGDVPYYQRGDVIYSKTGEPRFSVSAGWWLEIGTGRAKFYATDCWVYSRDGQRTYYFA